MKFLSKRQQWNLSPKEERIKYGSWAEKEAATGQEAEMDYQRHCRYIFLDPAVWKWNCSSSDDKINTGNMVHSIYKTKKKIMPILINTFILNTILYNGQVENNFYKSTACKDKKS